MSKKQYKTIEINEYGTTARIYDEELSIQDAREERAENEKIAKIGQPMLFLGQDFELKYPMLKNAKGEVVYQIVDGKKIAVKDLSRQPYWNVYKQVKNKYASICISSVVLIDLIESAISANYGADKTENAQYLEKLLNDVFPIQKIDFGAFYLDGPRELDKEKAHLLPKSRISLYSLPLLDKDGEKIVRKSIIQNEDGEDVSERITYIYGSNAEQGAQIGIKGGK